MSNAPTCPYCGQVSKLVDSAVVYHGKSYGLIYLCKPCDAYVGVHKGTSKPLGRLANKELREWKKRAHSVFDPIWQNVVTEAIEKHGYAPKGVKYQARSKAYAALARELKIDPDQCHIGMFDIDKCKATVRICNLRSEL